SGLWVEVAPELLLEALLEEGASTIEVPQFIERHAEVVVTVVRVGCLGLMPETLEERVASLLEGTIGEEVETLAIRLFGEFPSHGVDTLCEKRGLGGVDQFVLHFEVA